ncbi:hypothetical protein Q9S36_25480 [Microbacterium sp. ARD31]|uniref:hypothetical protein n=1 Tax=Microbacterium sp. ARD31 TaxID=2962576 RepID=UPI00288100FF|nr:hypothetical protein [Microbacterium sp. ARD31]MDT0183545.1 hypothetical protein [Microbacterium sp. ARD31]
METLDVRRTIALADVRRAWWSLLGFVPTFGLAFAVGEGLATALGHPPGGDEAASWWVMVVAGVPALLVFVLPAVVAVHFARRADRAGDRRGRLPATIAVAVAAGFVLLNLASAVGLVAG